MKTVALRFCPEMCHKYICRCGTLGGLCCDKSAGKYMRHSELNILIHRVFSSAKIQATLEPIGSITDPFAKILLPTLTKLKSFRID